MMATSEFGKAFAAARKAGDKTFTFNGKKYNTETRDDVVRRRNEAVGRSSTAGEKTPTTKAREFTSGMAKKERAAERSEAQRKDSEAIAKDVKTAADKRFMADVVRDAEATATRKKTQKYAKGGSVRGSGIEMRGTRKCKIV
jgi:hypothetical protein